MLIQPSGDTAFVVPISRIREANLKFLERDEFKELYETQLEITEEVKDKALIIEEKYLNEKQKVAILENLLSNQEVISSQEREKFKKQRKKTRKANLRTVGVAIVALIALIL